MTVRSFRGQSPVCRFSVDGRRSDGFPYPEKGSSQMNEESPSQPRRRPRAVADWLCSDRSDYREFLKRRESARHGAARELCRRVWMGAGILMILFPELPVIVGLVLGTTFLCFALLDD